MPTAVQYTVGQQFHSLTYLGESSPAGGRRRCLYRCVCGVEASFEPNSIKKGHRKSCGCQASEGISKANRKHGRSGSKDKTYKSWQSMRDRCLNPKMNNYHDYGGRGIKVCEQWASFEAFLSDMGERPAGHTLDRYPDTNGNYEPSNCRWATCIEQNNNRRSNVPLQYEGDVLTAAEWGRKTGLSTNRIGARIRQGWSIEEALVTPAISRKKTSIEFNGRTLSVSEWAREIGICRSSLLFRFRAGWPIERILTEPVYPRRPNKKK